MNIKQLFRYQPANNYDFTLTSVGSKQNEEQEDNEEIYPNIDLNIKYMKNKYNSSINSDILIREFSLTARNTRL